MTCGRCHTCLTELASDDWCPFCRIFRRYVEHGYGPVTATLGGECGDPVVGSRLKRRVA